MIEPEVGPMGRASLGQAPALALALLAACMSGDRGGSPTAFDGGDADADVDADADADAEGDADWPPIGGWVPEPPPEPDDVDPSYGRGTWTELARPICLDGTDETDEALRDCETSACFESGGCCQDLGWAWSGGRFGECPGLEGCGWRPFGDGGDAAPRIEGPWLVLSGSGQAEAGLATEPEVGLEGSPVLAFVAALGPDGCEATGPCRAALGVGLTSQAAVSGATGVEPALGIVLDGELEVVSLVLGGRSIAELPVARELLTEPRTYAVALDPAGRVALWVALPVEGEAVALDPTELEPDLVAQAPSLDVSARYRLAVWGRLDGGRAASLGGLVLEAWTCEVPGRLDRLTAPVRAPVLADERAARPAVALIPVDAPPPLDDDDPALLMIFETAYGLAAATSHRGDDWRFVGQILLGEPGTRYGRVSRAAPALLRWAAPGEEERYHLWHVGVAEGGERAILHATSAEGLSWDEAPGGEPVALEGDPSVSFRQEVDGPAVAPDGRGGLIMWFVGRDLETGATALCRATSGDGVAWQVDGEPVRLEPAPPAELEGDGISEPAVVRRGSVTHLWYVGLSGSRSAVHYATANDEEGRDFVRHGLALGPEAAWEGRRVSGPAALELPALDGEGALVHLWYAAGEPGHEAIGLARRWAPSR